MRKEARKDHHAERSSDAPGANPSASVVERGERIKESIDDLLGAIDEALEENAEEFIASYVQRGGQ